jgi:hypothetical protein
MYCLIIRSAAASRHVDLEFLANFKAQLPRGEQDAILVSRRRRRRGLSKQKKRFKMMMRSSIRNIYKTHFSPNHLIRLLLSPEGDSVYRLLLCDEPQEMNACNFRALLLLSSYIERRGDVLIHQPKGGGLN